MAVLTVKPLKIEKNDDKIGSIYILSGLPS